MGKSIGDNKTRNMSEKFCLKWNDFSSNASKSFGSFRNEDYLHDVTLVSDDQQQVTGHKLVLSASSGYFKSIFKNNKASNPFLCLEGVTSNDLNNILDYIYNGEVQIYQERLDTFLNTAQRFKIEGLLGEGNEVKEEQEEKEKIITSFSHPSRIRIAENKEKPAQPKTFTSIQLNNQIQPLDTNDLEEIDQKLYEHMEKNSDGRYSCKICSKTALDKTNMKFHVETHMEGLSFPCNTCGKEFRLRKSLKTHNLRDHRA